MKYNLKELKDSIVYVTPTFLKGETVRYKLKLQAVLLSFITYTLLIILFTIAILSLTPLKKVLFNFEIAELRDQAEKTIELENKVIFLTKELESISSTNKKLEYALILATTDSLDTNSAPYDSLKYEPIENLPYGGNLYYIAKELLSNLFQSEMDFFIKPSKALIINDFHPEEGHFGIDFAMVEGSPVFASKGGIIIFADYTIEDGNKIIVQHDNGFITVYKHCESILKRERDIVSAGEVIALSGNSGVNTTGPHLHFEIWKDGVPINPKENFIK